MIMRLSLLGAVALLAASACAKPDQPARAAASTTAPAGDRAQTAALTANAIAARPAAADSILKAHGYTPDGFQKLMYEIAADSAMSAEYAGARVR
jgi:hypothetical protein